MLRRASPCYLRCMSRLSEALTLNEGTLHRMRRKLGEMHPLTLSCAINLANCLGDSGEFAAAEAVERETISRLGQVLRHDHPDVLVCQANLVVTLRDTQREGEAKELKATRRGGKGAESQGPDGSEPDAGQRSSRCHSVPGGAAHQP
jgi:Tetratricopeptide repeat